MRLLHLSDWHLGRRSGRIPRAADHDAVLEEMRAIAGEFRPDLIVHSGDLWDVGRPAHDDLARGVEALRMLSEHAPLLVVCGNHDSPTLFRVLGRLPGVEPRIVFVAEARAQPYLFPTATGDVARVAALPFVHHNRAVRHFEHEPADRHADYVNRLRAIWAQMDAGLRTGFDASRDVPLLACHAHVIGARLSRSERPLTVAETYAARAEHLPPVAYAAFGHIHRPQPIPGGAGRYAGSPIALDFGEEDEEKSVVLVEARPRERTRVEAVGLSGGRPLRSIECEVEDLSTHADRARGALCRIVVRSEEPVSDLSERARAALPDAVVVQVEGRPRRGRLEAVRDLVSPSSQRPLGEVLRDYLHASGVGSAETGRLLRRFDELLCAGDTAEPARPRELRALEEGEPLELAVGAAQAET